MKWNSVEAAKLAVIRVVGRYEREVSVELTGSPASENIDQTMRSLRREHCDTWPLVREPDLDVHPEAVCYRLEGIGKFLSGESESVEFELDSLEEHLGNGVSVLFRVDYVPAVSPHEVCDGSDDARLVRTGQQQHSCGIHTATIPA